MTLQIFDTQAGRKVPFTPLQDKHIRLYVCGITAYDYCHIGHARSALVFDMIVKYLRYRGFKVTFVRNFTDIDDKIINRANQQGTTCEQLSERFIQAFYEDMAQLKVAQPDLEPRATQYIPEIINLVQGLIDKGKAYQAGNDVYFAVEQFADYGKLSGRNLEDMQAGARVEVNDAKRNPMDFALWKGSKPGEPTWDSPWGPGRPGWHIECSAMSQKLLGDTFDIHGGGKDLIFPHHENEIAQSEAFTGKPFAAHWIHHGFVTIKDEKMSKSLGNFLTIRDVLAHYHPEVLRYFVFSTHYRNPLDFSEAAMQDAATGLERLYTCMADIDALPAANAATPEVATADDRDKLATLRQRFGQAMDNDFNTAQAMGHLFEAVKILNRIQQGQATGLNSRDHELLTQAAAEIRSLATIMGLLTEEPAEFLQRRKTAGLEGTGLTAEDIEQKIKARNEARRNKEWAAADAIRDELLAANIVLKDGPEGTSWTVAGDHT